MVNICFNDIKVELRLYGFDELSGLDEEIRVAYARNKRIRDWFKLAFEGKREEEWVKIYGYSVTEELCAEREAIVKSRGNNFPLLKNKSSKRLRRYRVA